MTPQRINTGFKRLENVTAGFSACIMIGITGYYCLYHNGANFSYWTLIYDNAKVWFIAFLAFAVPLNLIRYIICGFFEETSTSALHITTLEEALHHINAAAEIISSYTRNKTYMPKPGDFLVFRRIDEALHFTTAATSHTEKCLRQRLAGKPEGAKKFTDAAVFDYHYPS